MGSIFFVLPLAFCLERRPTVAIVDDVKRVGLL